ncbi:MAG: Hsp20/alpha crystallin family protein [Parachlamydiales bacterium]|nr:Hsp20/alpha crystallin family protein [Parachlamydiales bacterium]
MRRREFLPSLFNELDFFRDFFDLDADTFSKSENNSISLYENDDKYFVEAALPGIDQNDIQISFEKGILWIQAESKKEEKDVKYYMKANKNCSYKIPIPQKVDENETPEATFKNGILKISFSKTKNSKPKKIEIKSK